MEVQKTLVCMCVNCGNEAEMTIKCEEVVQEKPSAPHGTPPPRKQIKRTIVCSQCGNEAEMIVDL